ncbi:MAG: hypothetical protein HOP12_15790 [Candidatus Eisenbacteria bacterium]|uniref:Uncharacterized protein n=1 Tax=Eiseniibacteriota bacterium TaxID=2212470 RepID=A0A849SRH6_UNCEI|nr:hypothetical protein [Candidatus Eisenbacteria bacterium]
MKRPVRPVALLILTACMLYPGLSALFQGFYPFVNGEWFTLMGHQSPFIDFVTKLGVPRVVPYVITGLIGLAWQGAVPGLWAGDWRAYPLALLAAAGSLLLGPGPAFMGVLALISLIVFRETAEVQPA